MNNHTSNFRINKYYLEKKKVKIKDLDQKNKKCKQDIYKVKQKIKLKENKIDKIKEEYNEYKERYDRFINIFNERGITINIVNKDYDLKEWSNLYLEKQGDIGVLLLKNGTIIKSFDKDVTDVLEEILKEKKFSIVITRVTNKLIKAQLHIR